MDAQEKQVEESGRGVSRRSFLRAASAGAGMMVLAACGGAAPAAPTAAPEAPAATPTSSFDLSKS